MAPKTKTPDRLTVEERRELPASAFGIPETREFPLVDAAHIRAAEAYFRYAPDDRKAALARRILARAREMGATAAGRALTVCFRRLMPSMPCTVTTRFYL